MTLPITITKEVQEEINLPVPCFFRDKGQTHYVGLLDEKTVVELFVYDDSVSICNRDINALFAKRTIQEAAVNLQSCTEYEFMEAFDKAWCQQRLRPELDIFDVLGLSPKEKRYDD